MTTSANLYPRSMREKIKHFTQVTYTALDGTVMEKWQSKYATIMSNGKSVWGWRHLAPDNQLIYPSIPYAIRQLG